MNNYGLLHSSSLLSKNDTNCVFRNFSKKSFSSKAVEESATELGKVIIHNATVAQKTIKYCHANGIKHYSIYHDLIPLLHDESVPCSIKDLPNHENIIRELKKIGILARKYSIDISVDLSKVIHLCGTTATMKKSAAKINLWSTIFDLFELSPDLSSPIIIQVNNSVNENEELKLKNVVDAFYGAFEEISDSAQNRITITNEKTGCWNCGNLFKWFHLYCGGEYGKFFSLSYNILNHKLNPSEVNGGQVTDLQNVQAFAHTWAEGSRPFFIWDEEPSESAFTEEGYDFGIPLNWVCMGAESDKNILSMRGDAVEESALDISTFDEFLSVDVDIDENDLEESEIDLAHKTIKRALKTKGGQDFNAIYGF
jgi:hypothetical protein